MKDDHQHVESKISKEKNSVENLPPIILLNDHPEGKQIQLPHPADTLIDCFQPLTAFNGLIFLTL